MLNVAFTVGHSHCISLCIPILVIMIMTVPIFVIFISISHYINVGLILSGKLWCCVLIFALSIDYLNCVSYKLFSHTFCWCTCITFSKVTKNVFIENEKIEVVGTKYGTMYRSNGTKWRCQNSKLYRCQRAPCLFVNSVPKKVPLCGCQAGTSVYRCQLATSGVLPGGQAYVTIFGAKWLQLF